jgi:dolichol-phosphate mannosyltransferase
MYVLYLALFTDAAVKGWASMIGITLTFNGFVLLMLGILGEYVGRIYDESKGRPLYIVQEFYSGRPQQSTQEQRVANLNK